MYHNEQIQKIRRARHVVCMREMRSTQELLVRKSEAKHTLGRPRCKQGDNIKKTNF